jgi:uncharacterized membrane protein (DUF485 family)
VISPCFDNVSNISMLVGVVVVVVVVISATLYTYRSRRRLERDYASVADISVV